LKTIRLLSRSAFAVGFLVLSLANTVLGQQPMIHGRVVAVTDGDTLKVLVAGQQLSRIRLAFCDAPEKKQAFGARAKQAMSELVFGKDIDLLPHAIDRYGRTVAQVVSDGKDVIRSSISDERSYSRLPKIAQTAGTVVTSPTTARAAPTAFRFSPSRSAKSRAIPAPRKARVTIINASSGRLSLISFTKVQIVEFARTVKRRECHPDTWFKSAAALCNSRGRS
jgi:hypothetical protein